MFSPEMESKFFGFENDQEGYWYDYNLRQLIEGRIVNFKLSGSIAHDGTDSDRGRFLCAFSEGYHYDSWDVSSVVYLPKDIDTLGGFMSWLDSPRTRAFEMKKYLDCKWMLEAVLKTSHEK
jgi:hypothetical protein